MRRAMVVVAHPDPDSFCHAMARAATERLQLAGHGIDHHDLYAEGFDPVLPAGESSTVGAGAGTTDPTVRRHHEDLRRADLLVVAHPNWWGKPPAIMAGWLDRTLVPGVAYRLDTAAGLPESMLRLERVVVLNTGDTPPDRERDVFGDPLDATWRRCVAGFLGGAAVHRLLAGPMGGSTSEQRRDWLTRAAALGGEAGHG